MRLYASPFNVDSQTRVAIVVGRLPNDILSMLSIFRMVILNSSLLLLFLAGVGGLFLADRTLKPVERITDIARGIGESDLSRRIDVESDDELGRLSETLNEMIGRLEEAFMKQRQFVADASHELRTPLAVIQAESSLVLEKSRTEPEYRKALELVSQEVSFMSDIVGKLLAPGPQRRRDRADGVPDRRRRRTCSRSSSRTSTSWPRTRSRRSARRRWRA